MTLEQAVAALNRERHRDYDKWEPEKRPGSPPLFINGPDRYEWLTPFEAIAIAKEYERLRQEKERVGCGYTEWSERKQYAFFLDPTYPG